MICRSYNFMSILKKRGLEVTKGQKLLFQNLFQLIQLSPTLAGSVIADIGGGFL